MADVKQTSPKVIEITGLLLSVDTLETQTGDIVLLSIQDAENKIQTISTSPNYWVKVGKFLAIDSVVQAKAEERKKDITGYDDKGTWKTHTSSGNNLSGITRFSEKAFERLCNSTQRDSDITLLGVVEETRVNAVATYLSHTFGR